MPKDCHTNDRKLDRRIVFWKIVIELYTAAIVTAIMILLASKGSI